MSRVPSLFALAGSALSAAPVDFRTPLRYVRENSLAANVSVTNSAGVYQIEAELTGAQWTILATDGSHSGPATLSFGAADSSGSLFEVVASVPLYFTPSAVSYIGIGPSGELTQRVGSVAVLKGEDNRAELVLASTRESFIAQCIPDTLVSMNLFADSRVTPKMNVGGVEVSFGTREMRIDNGRHLFSVPRAMFERIMESIAVAGANLQEGALTTGSFSECSPDILPHLSTITLTLASGGSLVYYPEDYVEFNGADNTCQLLIFRSPRDELVMFNPMKLQNTNLRVTRDGEWTFCDSSATL
jgi:hypothetical protein